MIPPFSNLSQETTSISFLPPLRVKQFAPLPIYTQSVRLLLVAVNSTPKPNPSFSITQVSLRLEALLASPKGETPHRLQRTKASRALRLLHRLLPLRPVWVALAWTKTGSTLKEAQVRPARPGSVRS